MTWEADAFPETTYGAASDLVLSPEELDEEEARLAARRPAGFAPKSPPREVSRPSTPRRPTNRASRHRRARHPSTPQGAA